MDEPPTLEGRNDDEGTLASLDPEPIEGRATETPLDWIGGHCLPYGALVLLHGLPGSGKSRVALCAADTWCSGVARAFYVMNEEAESMDVRTLRRYAQEHHIRNLRAIYPILGTEDLVPEWMKNVQTLRDMDATSLRVPILWVIDSTSDLDVVNRVKAFVQRPRCAALIIAQDTKGGEYSGASAFGHLVNVIAEIVRPSERKEDRIMKISKNRFGQTGSFPCPWPPR